MKKAGLRCLVLALAMVFAFPTLTACNDDAIGISATGTEAVYTGEAQLPEITVTGTTEKVVEIYADGQKVNEAVNAGDYVVKVIAGKTEKSFDFKIKQKQLEVNSLDGFSKVYDGTTAYNAEIVSPEGTVIGDEVTAKIDGTFASAEIGKDKTLSGVNAVLDGADKDNYSLKTANELKADITAKILTVKGIVAESAAYGQVENTGVDKYEVRYSGNAVLEGVIDGENVTINIVSVKYKELKVGNVELVIEATLGGEDAGNYALATNSGLYGTIEQDSKVFTVSDDGEITAYDGDKENLVIPATINGITVRSIADGVFKNNSYEEDGFKTVVLPSTLEKIGKEAFANNYVLKEIVIPASVKEIGESAFFTCGDLKTITFEDGEESLTVGVSAFEKTSATNVTIPDRMTVIPNNCFTDSDGGSGYVKIHNGVTSIGIEAFLNRSNAGGFTQIEFEKGGTESLRLERQAFAGARFNAMEIPARCVFVGFACMQNCKELTSLTFEDRTEPIEWGQNAAAGGPFTFAGCGKLESVTIPKEVGTFKASFQECMALKTVVLEDGITEIGNYAFFQCGITSVSIPKSVQRIGLAAFQNCNMLTQLTIESGNGEADLTIEDWAFAWAPVTSLYFPKRVVSIGFATFKNHNATSITFELQRDKMLTFEHHPFMEGFPDESSAFNLDQTRTMDPVVLPKNVNLTLEEIASLSVFPAGTQVSISEN